MARKLTKKQKKNYPQYKNIHAPAGKHWCSYHKKYEPIENFPANRHKVRGLDNKCFAGGKEYREEYKKKYGRRADISKTMRMSPAAHSKAMAYCKSMGITQKEFMASAIDLYIKFGCTYPRCTELRVSVFGKCYKHSEEVVIRPGDKLR